MQWPSLPNAQSPRCNTVRHYHRNNRRLKRVERELNIKFLFQRRSSQASSKRVSKRVTILCGDVHITLDVTLSIDLSNLSRPVSLPLLRKYVFFIHREEFSFNDHSILARSFPIKFELAAYAGHKKNIGTVGCCSTWKKAGSNDGQTVNLH